ncbi:MAG TPA: OB-fold domain-containing protein [Acidimicrobiia bacterium]|nr:OB-fold domain-containing protein [Acidimicrobiia bacterium]
MTARKTTHTIEFPYTRTLGPALREFMTGLRDGRIVGVRSNDGRVLCPPCEWDPETGEPLALEFVDVGPGGVVQTWSWVTEPTAKHPLPHEFAMALIKLDGADTALVHAVDARDIDAMSTGMRVTPRWKSERVGRIDDIEAFVPEGAA